MDSFLDNTACALPEHLVREEIRDFNLDSFTTQRLVTRNKSGLILSHTCNISGCCSFIRTQTIWILLQIIQDGLLSALAQNCWGGWCLRAWHHTQLAEICTEPIPFWLFLLWCYHDVIVVISFMDLGCTRREAALEIALILLIIDVGRCCCDIGKIDILETTFSHRQTLISFLGWSSRHFIKVFLENDTVRDISRFGNQASNLLIDIDLRSTKFDCWTWWNWE